MGLLGASVALNRKAHLGVDYFVDKLSVRKRLYAEVFIYLIIALFSFFVLMVGGGQLVTMTLKRAQVSPALGLKMGYVYLALPISGFFLCFYSIEFLYESLKALIHPKAANS